MKIEEGHGVETLSDYNGVILIVENDLRGTVQTQGKQKEKKRVETKTKGSADSHTVSQPV